MSIRNTASSAMATLEVDDLTPFWMTKIQIYDEDGIYRGGLPDLDTHCALNCRVWPVALARVARNR